MLKSPSLSMVPERRATSRSYHGSLSLSFDVWEGSGSGAGLGTYGGESLEV